MSVFKVTVIKDYQQEQNKLEKGMNVELYCFYPSPTIYHGLYINQAFMKKYGFDLKGIGWNTSEFLEIDELDHSTLDNLTRELKLIKIEKSNSVFAQRFEDVAQLRNAELKILEKIETLKIKNMKDQLIKQFVTEQIGENAICKICRTEHGIDTTPLTPYLFPSDDSLPENRIMFIGKTARGDGIGDYIDDTIEDVTKFGNEFIRESSWAFYSYTREIIETYFGDLEEGIKNISFSNMVKCNNSSMTDETTYEAKVCCVDKNQFIWKELNIINPKRIIFYTHYYYDNFIEQYRPNNCTSIKDITDKKERVDIGEKTSLFWHREFYDKDDNLICTFLRTSHPMMKNREDFVESILQWLNKTGKK